MRLLRSIAGPPIDARSRSRGQVIVMFALSIVLFVSLCAVVVDVAFYWVSTLRAQRAADAAALSGSVYLPGDKATAYAIAIASATQNDYTGGGATTVTPTQDTSDPRQLDVAISASVPTFFARVLGITSWPMAVSAKAVYVLPVPMGSPLAYYGVGNYSVNNTTNYVQWSAPGYASSPTSGAWTTPDRAWTTGSSFATSATDGSAQQWTTMNVPAITGTQLDGIVVSFKAKVSTAAAACQVQTEISWNAGGTWNNVSPALTTPTLTKTGTPYAIGSQTLQSAWGNNHTWVPGDFTNANFRVRLTYLKGSGCGTLSLNSLVATAYSHTTVMTTALGLSDGSTFLNSQGGWGAIITRGGNQGNGDAYATANNGSSANAKFDPNGYKYTISLPSGGTVKVFDPGFCAMGSNGVAGSMGTGDHWIGTVGTPVSTYYTLWNTNGKPGLPGAWTQLYNSAGLFEGQTGYDPANTAPGVTSGTLSGATAGCDAYHLAWWTVPTGTLGAGTYVLQAQTSKTGPPSGTTDTSVNAGTNAENGWSIEAAGSAAQVYGSGRMVVYNNLQATATPQQFYLAKIDRATGAGKTAQIDLFDIGDLGSGSGTLQVFSPDGGSAHAVNFNYTSDSNCVVQSGTSPCSGNNVNQIVTTSNGAQSFNNTWIHITIPLDTTYGSTGLWQGGWWQIVYTTPQGGNDTTTWEVSVSGNPVHLLVP